MKCKRCKEQLDMSNITVEVAAHDDEKLDIIIECPACDYTINGFIGTDEMIEIEA